jgi:AraC-like DNA-binding protein
MENKSGKMEELIALIEKNAPREGRNQTAIPGVELFRESEPHKPKPLLYEPYFIFVAQGRKRSVLDDVLYNYDAGHFLTTLAPMPVECEIVEASAQRPLLAIGILLDRRRMLNILLKMDQVEQIPSLPAEIDPSGIFTAPLNAKLLDAVTRLLKTLDSPAEAAIIGEAVIDEIYFRILRHERGGALPHLLQQRGQIQQIARAVEHVHQNLAGIVSVEDLAALVNMSCSAFHKKFKEVMHLSPLQYAKRVKLDKAQAHILEGRSVSEAGYMVGYNSPAQFSREYKRRFGVLPSDDRAGPCLKNAT